MGEEPSQGASRVTSTGEEPLYGRRGAVAIFERREQTWAHNGAIQGIGESLDEWVSVKEGVWSLLMKVECRCLVPE